MAAYATDAYAGQVRRCQQVSVETNLQFPGPHKDQESGDASQDPPPAYQYRRVGKEARRDSFRQKDEESRNQGTHNSPAGNKGDGIKDFLPVMMELFTQQQGYYQGSENSQNNKNSIGAYGELPV